VFLKVEENNFVAKAYRATRGVVKIYTAGVVIRDRRIGPWIGSVLKHIVNIKFEKKNIVALVFY
jgi:hypothetical protein